MFPTAKTSLGVDASLVVEFDLDSPSASALQDVAEESYYVCRGRSLVSLIN